MTIRTALSVAEEIGTELKEFGKKFTMMDRELEGKGINEAQVKIVEKIIRKYQKEIISEVAALDGAGFDDVMFALRMK